MTWSKFDNSAGSINESMDGVYVPILPSDRVNLEFHIKSNLQEAVDSYNPEYDRDKDEYVADCTEDYMTRLEATHFFLFVTVPEDEEYEDVAHEDYTWWDFGSLLAKRVDGEWYLWDDEGPGTTGCIWYQTTYTKTQVYAVRDFHIQWAERGELLSGEYDGQCVYDACKAEIMPFW
jgi:hypothetical protein